MILALRTDKPTAELYLLDKNGNELAKHAWEAHRELSQTILLNITNLLAQNDKTLQDVGGLVVFNGSGSFTGLRIGIAVTNGLADSLDIPVVSADTPSWLEDGCKLLSESKNEHIVQPRYESPARVTKQKK